MPISRRPTWQVAGGALVGLLAARVVWLAWSYYFRNAPRYPLESAAMALIAVGTVAVLLRAHNEQATRAHDSGLPIMWLPVFLIGAVSVYWPAFWLGLLSDDYVLRAMAQSGTFGTGSSWFFRPVPLLVWRLLLAVTSSPVSLHALNILLHGLNAFLVALLGVRLGVRREAALVGGALFLTFPAGPEAVAWSSGIQDVLLTTMSLGAVIAASAENSSGLRTTVVCGMLALGLGSKETAICIPALLAICCRAPSRIRRDWRLYVSVVAVTAAYSLVRVSMGIRSGFLTAPSRYFLKQVVTTAFGTLATPWRAPASPPAQWLAFAAVAALVLLITFSFLSWGRGDNSLGRATRLTLWVLAAVAPVFTYFFVNPMLEGSRYLYLAEGGWALLVADLMITATDRVGGRSLLFALVAGAALVVSTVTLERELSVWRRAADLRDNVITQARASIVAGRCTATHFVDVPDSVDGAYVFRNGLREALGLAEGETTTTEPECILTWNGDRFVQAR